MEPKWSPKASQNEAKIDWNLMQNSIDFSIDFCSLFGGSGRGPDPWFAWQGRHFHGVRPFWPRPEKPLKMSAKMIRKASKNEAKNHWKNQWKFEWILSGFWKHFGSQIWWFWEPKWHQKDTKKSIKFWRWFWAEKLIGSRWKVMGDVDPRRNARGAWILNLQEFDKHI